LTQPTADRLALLYRVSQAFNSSLDLDEVLTRVMDEVITATRAERGFLMLKDDGGQLVFRAARGMDQQTINAPEFQVSRGVIERVAAEGVPRLASDAQTDAALSLRASVVGLGLRSILCVPLQIKGDVIGVIYVDNRMQAGIFSHDELDLLMAIGSSAAIAIENARLYQVAVEKGRMEREMQVAFQAQSSLIPQETPQIAGWDFAALWKPARVVGGDYYDFISVPARGQSPMQGIVIADVSDKGTSAALFMTMTRSIVRASIAPARSPADSIALANHLVCSDAADGMFVTLFYAQINPATGQVTYVNAGHNPPLWYRADRDQFVQIKRTGLALGMEDGSGYKEGAAQFEPGDFLFLYTDGITEAVNAHIEEFGGERLQRVLFEHRRAASAEIVAALENELNDFIGTALPFDDITLVIAKRI
jgi:sigma-B regulation protein RsbU (phosphoserine phosphatase)